VTGLCRALTKGRKTLMKLHKIAFIVPSFVMVLALAGSAGAGEEVSLDQVPDAVKQTIQHETKGGKLDSIEEEHKKGKPIVYEVEYTAADGKEYELKISEDGKLLKKEED
jgi:uncharacterized protein YpmB